MTPMTAAQAEAEQRERDDLAEKMAALPLISEEEARLRIAAAVPGAVVRRYEWTVWTDRRWMDLWDPSTLTVILTLYHDTSLFTAAFHFGKARVENALRWLLVAAAERHGKVGRPYAPPIAYRLLETMR